MTIIIAGWITIIIGFALTILTLVNGLRSGIKENQAELKRLESAGFASTYTAAPRKQSVYSGPIAQGVKGRFTGPSRSARQMLKEVEEDIREDNIALRKDNTIDAVLDPLRTRDKQVAGGASSASHAGTSILEDDEVKEIRASDGTDVLFSVVYNEPDENQAPKAEKKPKTDILNGTDVLTEGTDVLTEKTDVLENGTGVLSLNENEDAGTDILPKGETEPLVSFKEKHIQALKNAAEESKEIIGTDILTEGTDILEEDMPEETEENAEGTDVLRIGTDILPPEGPEGTDVLIEGTDVLPGNTDILPEGTDILDLEDK